MGLTQPPVDYAATDFPWQEGAAASGCRRTPDVPGRRTTGSGYRDRPRRRNRTAPGSASATSPRSSARRGWLARGCSPVTASRPADGLASANRAQPIGRARFVFGGFATSCEWLALDLGRQRVQQVAAGVERGRTGQRQHRRQHDQRRPAASAERGLSAARSTVLGEPPDLIGCCWCRPTCRSPFRCRSSRCRAEPVLPAAT